MTGFFNSRSGSTVRNYHYYVPSDVKLHDIGLASYTRNSLEKFGKRKKNGIEENDPDINEYLSGGIDSIKPILLGKDATLIIYRFDKETKRYLYTTSDGANEDNIYWSPRGGVMFQSLETFQQQFDLYQKGWVKDETEVFNIKYIWSKINNSLSGCITFDINNYSILNSPSAGVVQLYFQSRGDGSQRGIAFQPPIIAGVGRTATGQEHAFNISESFPIGSLSRPDVGGATNPNNTIAGPMRLHFNRGTGEWESGTTQVYCQVLEDLGGISSVDLPSNVDIVDNDTLKLPFTSGIGMVMSDEKGNPHLCAPVSFGCEISEKEKIILVNRTPRSFVKGEKILASNVNGSWIPIPLQNGTNVPKKFGLQWSQIQKYIVNAKGFFRDTFDEPLDHNKYKDLMRGHFYNTLSTLPEINKAKVDLESIKVINLSKVTFDDKGKPIYTVNAGGKVDLSNFPVPNIQLTTPSFNYDQMFDADIISTKLGGNNTLDILRNTNISQTEAYSQEDGVAADSVPFSWGMYFPNGYSTADVRRLQSTTSVTSAYPSLNIYTGGSLDFTPYTNAFQTDKLNLKDLYFYHMPAQIALNASGNQSIRWQQLHPINAGKLIQYIQDPFKGDWLKASGGKDAYKLTPLSPSKVQFTPLSLELALSSTIIKDEGVGGQNPVNGGYKKLKSNLDYMRTLLGNDQVSYRTFGKAWNRLNAGPVNISPDGDDSVRGYIEFGERLANRADQTGTVGPPKRVDRPAGGPEILPFDNKKESSNVVGIIAAKATITLQGGGNLQIKTSNKFGLLAYTKVTLSNSSWNFFQTGGTLFGSDTGGQNRKYDEIQWGGSIGDKVEDLGTTALWCAVYDHCPNTAYDGRYFSPLQFNPSGENMDFKQVTLAVNTTVDKNTLPIQTENIAIRRSMLLTNGGFGYIRKVIVAGTPKVEKAGTNYVEGESVTFSLGSKPAVFKVASITGDGGISSIELDPDLGVDALGETKDGIANPFKGDTPLTASIKSDKGTGAKITLDHGKVIEKLYVDRIKQYGEYKKVTPPDNAGQGDDRGFVRQNKSTVFSVEENSTGKYDIFFFFVSDILNHPEAGVGSYYEGGAVPPARYVNLEITAG